MEKTFKIAIFVVTLLFLCLESDAINCVNGYITCEHEFANASVLSAGNHDEQCRLIKVWMACVQEFVEECGYELQNYEVIPNVTFSLKKCVNDPSACGKDAASTCQSYQQQYKYLYLHDKCGSIHLYQKCLLPEIYRCTLHPSDPVIYPLLQQINTQLNENNCSDQCLDIETSACETAYRKGTRSKIAYDRCGSDQTYLNCIKNIPVICGTETRKLNFDVDTSKIKADISFNKCDTDAWVCITREAARCSTNINFRTIDCFETRKLKNCLNEIGTTCSHDLTSQNSYIGQAMNASYEDILTNGCVDVCASKKLQDCKSKYDLEKNSNRFDRLKLCSATTTYINCVNDVVSYCNLTRKQSSKNFTFLIIDDIRREIKDVMTYLGCQYADGCASNELQQCSSTYTNVLSEFRSTQVHKCIATSVYLECVDNVISVCGLKNALTSTSSMLTYINDTREETHKWLSRYNCISDEVCAHAQSFKCRKVFKKEINLKEITKPEYCSAAYVFDRCLNRIVLDCNLANNSLVFYGLKDTIGQLEWQIRNGGCPGVDDCADEKLTDCSSKYSQAEKASKNDMLKHCRSMEFYMECVNDVASYCNLTRNLLSQSFTFRNIDDTRRGLQDMITHQCQNVDDCTIDELKDCTSAYTNATAAFGRTGVKNCSAAVKYMECMNKVVSICNSRSAFASESYTLSFINDTHNKLHELMSGYDCLSVSGASGLLQTGWIIALGLIVRIFWINLGYEEYKTSQ